MKRGWEIKKLSELFTIKPPKKLAKEKLDDEDEISFVPMACLNIEDRDLSLKQSKQLKDAYKGYTYFADNDVLLAKITPCFENGKVGIAKGLLNGIGFGSSEFIVFRPNGHVVPEYLYYYLSQESFRDEGKNRMAGAVGHKRVSKEFIEEYLLPFPESTKEQNRIVAILDKAFTAIDKAKANAEKNLANAKELFESYLNGIFENPGEDWEEEKLGECLKLKSGDNITSKMMIEDGKYSVFGGNGIAGYYNKSNLSGSNVIIGRVGALCGNVRHIQESIWLTDNGFKVTDTKYDFDNDFLTYLLNYKKLRSFARQAAQPVISNSSLHDVLLFFPKLISEQKKIVHTLDELSAETKKYEAICHQKIDNLDEMKKSILKKVFEEEL